MSPDGLPRAPRRVSARQTRVSAHAGYVPVDWLQVCYRAGAEATTMTDQCARKALVGWSLLLFWIGRPWSAISVGDGWATVSRIR